MIETKSVRRKVDEPVAKVCDRCGKRVVLDSPENRCVAQEFIRINHTCGFDSVIGDGLILDIDLCDSCIKELLLPYARVSGNELHEKWAAAKGDELKQRCFAEALARMPNVGEDSDFSRNDLKAP